MANGSKTRRPADGRTVTARVAAAVVVGILAGSAFGCGGTASPTVVGQTGGGGGGSGAERNPLPSPPKNKIQGRTPRG